MKDPVALKIDRTLRHPVFLILLVVAGLVLVAAVILLWPVVVPDSVEGFLQDLLGSRFWFPVILIAVILGLTLTGCAACILAERKLAGYIQDRVGPNRVGFLGLFQPVADGIKMFTKEDIIPANVDRPLYLFAPMLAFTIALLGFAIIPWAGEIHFPWMPEGQTVCAQVAGYSAKWGLPTVHPLRPR